METGIYPGGQPYAPTRNLTDEEQERVRYPRRRKTDAMGVSERSRK